MVIKFTVGGDEWEAKNDGLCYSLYHIKEAIKADRGDGNRAVHYGYFKTFGASLKKAINISNASSEEVLSINEYVERWEKALDRVYKTTEDDIELG